MGTVVHVSNPSTQEAESKRPGIHCHSRLQRIQGQPRLHEMLSQEGGEGQEEQEDEEEKVGVDK